MTRKQRRAQILTISLLAAIIAVAIVRNTGLRASIAQISLRAEATPQDTIYAMLDAARAGDVKKYCAAYTGQMEQSLKLAISESPDFSKYLKESNAAIKGIAVQEPQALSDREVKARVEYVYQDRNEAQIMYLERTPGGWRIARVDAAERVKTLIPYGTPVQ